MMSHLWNGLASPDSHGLLWVLAISAAKATLLLAFTALLCLSFRRSSAATRHLLWSSVMCASLLLPFFSLIKVWEVPILPADTSVSSGFTSKELKGDDEALEAILMQGRQDLSTSPEAMAVVRVEAEAQNDVGFLRESLQASVISAPSSPSQKEAASVWPRPADCVLAVWAIGALLLLLRLLVGFIATNSLARRAIQFTDPALNRLFSSLRMEIDFKGSLRLLCSEQTTMPIVCGIWRPSILLPADAETWPEERQRMVLLHELTHVTRRDCLTQMIAQTACALYWFNPLIWCAARRLRIEREKACDDFVLSIGTRPSDYAHHLLEIARSVRERSVFKWSQTASVAMARRSQLEGRLLAILSKEKREGVASRSTTFGLLSLTVVLFLSLGALRPTAINARGAQTAGPSNAERDEAPIFRPYSLAIGSEQPVNTIAETPRTSEAFRAEESSAAAGHHLQEQPLNPEQADDSEQNIKQIIEPQLRQEVVEAVSQLSATSIQSPTVKTETSTEPTPFVNTEYRPERRPQAQEKQGDFIDEMASVGYTNLSVDELVRLKTAGVTAEYVQSLRALGIGNLTPKEVASLSVLGVTPSYIKLIRSAGYNELSPRELSAFRVQNITPDYIKAIRDAGYPNLTARQMIEFATHRVTPAFISGIRAVGYSSLSPRELVSLRVFNVTPEFVRQARSRFGELSVRQIISLKSTGLMEDDEDKEKDKDKDNDRG